MLGQNFQFTFPHFSLPTFATYTPEGAELEIVTEKFRSLPDGRGYNVVGLATSQKWPTPAAPVNRRFNGPHRGMF